MSDKKEMAVVGVYVDDLMDIGTCALAVDRDFNPVDDGNQGPWARSQFLGTRVQREEYGAYKIDL